MFLCNLVSLQDVLFGARSLCQPYQYSAVCVCVREREKERDRERGILETHLGDKSLLRLRACNCVVLIFVVIIKHLLCASSPRLLVLVKSIWIVIISRVLL